VQYRSRFIAVCVYMALPAVSCGHTVLYPSRNYSKILLILLTVVIAFVTTALFHNTAIIIIIIFIGRVRLCWRYVKVLLRHFTWGIKVKVKVEITATIPEKGSPVFVCVATETWSSSVAEKPRDLKILLHIKSHLFVSIFSSSLIYLSF